MDRTHAFWRTLAHSALLALLLAACGVETTTPGRVTSPVTVSELEGRDFVLERSDGFEPIAGSTVRLTFTNGGLTFHSGCNYQGGPIEIRDGVLQVTVDSTTDALCSEHQAQDEWLARFLESRPRISLTGDRLVLHSKAAKLTFLDGELAEPDQPLAGLPWVLGEFMMDAHLAPVPTPVRPQVTFFADGSLRIQTGCNTASGRWSLSSPELLSLTTNGYTEEGCSPPQSFADQHVRAILGEGEVSFSIDRNRLTLRRANLSMVGVRADRASGGTLDEPAAPGVRPSQLAGMHYLLERSEGFTLLPGAQLHLIFSEEGLSFSAGCNGGSGPFAVNDGKLIVEGLSSTARGCSRELLRQDEWLHSFFRSRPGIVRDGDRISLRGSDATLVFLDRELADPDQPLAGPTWTMDTLLTRDSASSGSGTHPTLTFREDGSLTISTTCAAGRANYTLTDSQITFTNVVYDEQECLPENRLHAHVKQVIADGTAQVEIEARSLTIMHGEIGLAGRREAP